MLRWIRKCQVLTLEQYILVLEEEFELDLTPKGKPVLGWDDVLLLINKDQRHAFATILILPIFTGVRPAELVDAMKSNAPQKYSWEHPETPDLDKEEDFDSLDDDLLNPKDHLEDPDYDKPQPGDNVNDAAEVLGACPRFKLATICIGRA